MRRRITQLALPLLSDEPADARPPMDSDRIRKVFPPGADVCAVAGQWWQREDGSITALYTHAQWELCREIVKE